MDIVNRSLRCCLLVGFLAYSMQALAANLAADETSLLWRVESPDGKTSYLFGTMHSDDARINNFSPQVLDAIAQSETFIMEVLPPQDQSAYLMPDQKLDALLNKKETLKVSELAGVNGLPEDFALRMKPWLLAMVLDQPHMQTPYTQDLQLFSLARQQGKKIDALETVDEHFNLLDGLEMREQLQILRLVLKRTQQDKQRDFDLLLQTYLQGNIGAIAQLDQAMTANQLPKGLWEKMRVKLIDERNKNMAERLAEKAKAHSLFVAVGAAHFPGKTGLIASLREAGYQVTPIKQSFESADAARGGN